MPNTQMSRGRRPPPSRQPSRSAHRPAPAGADRDAAANEIRVTTDRPGAHPGPGLAVLLDERVCDMERELVVLLNGEEVFRGQPERRLETILRTSRHPDPDLVFSARVALDPSASAGSGAR